MMFFTCGSSCTPRCTAWAITLDATLADTLPTPGTVRAAAQALVDKAAANGRWDRVSDVYFDVPVAYRDFADFERRMVNVTYADRRFDEATRTRLLAIFERHMTADGARFVRPMHVTLLRRR